MTFVLDARLAARFAAVALDNVVREYPNKLDHVMEGAIDVRSPRELHPAFYGSFDWHSCVHMHWLLARVRRLHPGLPQRAAIDAVFDAHFTHAALRAERAYLARPASATFERTYGWAWLLKLGEELSCAEDAAARGWSDRLGPLADAFVEAWLDYLQRARHPLRSGLHANSAFGLAFALDFARATREARLEQACVAAAQQWYLGDHDYPAAWEPSGTDFLSPALIEADLMRRILPADPYGRWLGRFLPGFGRRDPATLFTPVQPSDRSDGQIVHLDGLNLSRAWCLRGVAQALPPDDPRQAIALGAAERHLAVGMTGVASDDYMGSHWLASFATLALTGS